MRENEESRKTIQIHSNFNDLDCYILTRIKLKYINLSGELLNGVVEMKMFTRSLSHV